MPGRGTPKPWWQQATALVSVSTSGVVTGLAFAPGTPAELTTPGRAGLHLLALEHLAAPGQAATPAAADDALPRAAIVNVARYYLKLARARSAAQMEALIWGGVSADGADHGQSCAAFASLTLALGAQAAGQRSWVTGGGSYPWPLREWADVRVDPSPSSLSVTSILQDAREHQRWHPLGDGYQPRPGDWALFDGHVEVVTSDDDGTLHTIGADSLPGYTVNAHAFAGPPASHGITGFADNGHLPPARVPAPPPATASIPGLDGTPAGEPGPATVPRRPNAPATTSQPNATAAIPGLATPPPGTRPGATGPATRGARRPAATGSATTRSAAFASIPGLDPPGTAPAVRPAGSARKPASSTGKPSGGPAAARLPSAPLPPARLPPSPLPPAQRAFISAVAPGAIAAQHRYGVPASVTIAQAIEESAWGRSSLAVRYHNLFGIKGSGPAGSAWFPTSEYAGGQWVTVNAAFRAYHNDAESIADHARLLATSGYYARAMALRSVPDAFANALTGVYATDPQYGARLIAIMLGCDLYQYDSAASPQAASPQAAGPGAQRDASIPGIAVTASRAPRPTPARANAGLAVPQAARARSAVNFSAAGASPAKARLVAWYQPRMPESVRRAFAETAGEPLAHLEPLYRDVAGKAGISWKVLAACDWAQCQASPRRSPVHGERLGQVNPDGSSYRTKSKALAQCAADLIELPAAVYGIDLTCPRPLSVQALAEVFAAFRWGGLLARHGVSAMEFPYSVAGLTSGHLKMHWPAVDERDAPDKPGAKFRMPFGAVPAVLCLGYPATR